METSTIHNLRIFFSLELMVFERSQLMECDFFFFESYKSPPQQNNGWPNCVLDFGVLDFGATRFGVDLVLMVLMFDDDWIWRSVGGVVWRWCGGGVEVVWMGGWESGWMMGGWEDGRVGKGKGKGNKHLTLFLGGGVRLWCLSCGRRREGCGTCGTRGSVTGDGEECRESAVGGWDR